MPLLHDLSTAQLEFRVTGEAEDRFQVIRFRGTEGLCQLYRFEIDLTSTEPLGSLDAIVGAPAVLTVHGFGGDRWFHGIIGRFEMTGETHGQSHFRAELVPAVWLLTHRYNSRIFQNRSVPEIVSNVLARGGIASDRFRLDLTGTYEPREYCVQYRETDYNFICRLMEEEGIRWYFEQTQNGHTLILADSAADYPPIDDDPVLPYHPPSGLNVEHEHVCRFRLGQSVRPGAVVLNDFNFEKPRLNLRSASDNSRDHGLEFSEYPGEYTQQSQGARLAKLRAEEFESGRVVGVGQSNCHRLTPGRSFTLCEHPCAALNAEYLISSITHQGKEAVTRTTTGSNGTTSILLGRTHQSVLAATRSQDETVRELAEALLQIASRFKPGDPTAHRAVTQWLYHAGQVSRDLAGTAQATGSSPAAAASLANLIDDFAQSSGVDYDAPVYECRFECIPAGVAYRPPRVTPWPVMRGSQTARVVGPASEEIHTDKYGRVKVQFNWDREGKFDENASCWIRVSQGSAGGQYGMMFLPRVGQEVIVDFLEGNPDNPIITGRVYNADQMPPYELPAHKTRSGIKTHSTKGGGGTNEFRFEDLKGSEQILLHAQKDLHVRVKNDSIENVEHDRHLTVDANELDLIKQNKNVEVRLDFSEKIGGKRSLEVVGDVGEEFKSNYSQKVASNAYVKVGQALVIESGKEITFKVGGNFVKIDANGVTIWGTKVKINSGGSPGNGSLVALRAPVAPLEADKVIPGQDVTYSGGEELPPGLVDPDLAGTIFTPTQVPEKKTSWIEIELVDEIGQPVPDEEYEITAPDGQTIRKGRLDKNGQAHVNVPDPGLCQITFPNLDSPAWNRAGTASAGQPGSSQPSTAAGPTTGSGRPPVAAEGCGTPAASISGRPPAAGGSSSSDTTPEVTPGTVPASAPAPVLPPGSEHEIMQGLIRSIRA